jgi:hypothetical protein
MIEVIRPDLEKRESEKSFILRDENNLHKGGQHPGTVLIEPGGIVQLRYRGRRVGIRITKAVANKVVGKIIFFEISKKSMRTLPSMTLLFSKNKIFSATTLL